jgi:hypothetical protein
MISINHLNGRPERGKQPACRSSGAFGNGDNPGGRMIKQRHQRIQKTAAQAIMDTGVSVKIDMDARHDPAVAYQQTADNRQKRRLFQMSEDNDGRLFSQTNDPQDANRPSSRKINPGYLWRNVPQINPAAVPHQHIDGETLIGKAVGQNDGDFFRAAAAKMLDKYADAPRRWRGYVLQHGLNS